MIYTKAMLGQELKEKVLQRQDVVEIGIWAYSVYLECDSEVDAKLLQLMLHLNTLELGICYIPQNAK